MRLRKLLTLARGRPDRRPPHRTAAAVTMPARLRLEIGHWPPPPIRLDREPEVGPIRVARVQGRLSVCQFAKERPQPPPRNDADACTPKAVNITIRDQPPAFGLVGD